MENQTRYNRPNEMSSIPHIPALRRGKPYESLDTVEVKDFRTGEVKATVSQVNAGIVRKDLARVGGRPGGAQEILGRPTHRDLREGGRAFSSTARCRSATRATRNRRSNTSRRLSSTSGLPHVMVRRNMEKIHYALTNMKTVLNGLSRGLDLAILDSGSGEQFGTRLSFFPTTPALGLVMPSNSPAVNSLWLPAIALKTPVIIKPGKEEPWTPYRLIQAFIAAGAPAEAFGFYPTDHEGAGEILKTCGRALIFGDKSTTQQYANNPGDPDSRPGLEQVSRSARTASRTGAITWTSWPRAFRDNGGRSCINASRHRRAEVCRRNRRRAGAEARPDSAGQSGRSRTPGSPASRIPRWRTSSTARSRTA